MTSIARRLRREMTLAEKMLWPWLRSGRLEGLKFRRQHPIAGRVADFACVASWLVVELDGPVHELPGVDERDAARTAVLEAQGWRLVRFQNRQVLEDLEGVLDAILSAAKRPPN